MNFQLFLTSKLGRVLFYLVSGFVSLLTMWLGEKVPWLHFGEIVLFLGGSVQVVLAIFAGLCLLLNWVQAHWAHENMKAVQVVQEAVNAAIDLAKDPSAAALTPVKVDGRLGQETGAVLNALLPAVTLPVERLAAVKPANSKSVGAALGLVFLVVGALWLFTGCASPLGRVDVHADAESVTVSETLSYKGLLNAVTGVFFKRQAGYGLPDYSIAEGLRK